MLWNLTLRNDYIRKMQGMHHTYINYVCVCICLYILTSETETERERETERQRETMNGFGIFISAKRNLLPAPCSLKTSSGDEGAVKEVSTRF